MHLHPPFQRTKEEQKRRRRRRVAVWAIFLVLVLTNQCSAAGGGGFVRTDGCHFVVSGSPFLADGFNAYWLMLLASDPSQRSHVSDAFRDASSHGLTVTRTWAFNDGGPSSLQYSPGSYNEQMFRGLDFVMSEARRYKIRVILSLVNNYDSFGGKKQYVQWARNQGQNVWSDDDFFTNPVVKSYYKNHVKGDHPHCNEALIASGFIQKRPQLQQDDHVNSSHQNHMQDPMIDDTLKKSNLEGHTKNTTMTSDFIEKSNPCAAHVRETMIQEMCDETSLVAYRLIGLMLDKFNRPYVG